MKKPILTLTLLSIAVAVVFQACNKDDDDDPAPKANEFIADDNSFAGFESWGLHDTRMGADPALGPMAHGGNDSTVTRKIYIKDGASAVNGVYPTGTLIAKRSTSPAGMDMITAMAKRGNKYNTAGNDWEYFILNADGSIVTDSTGTVLRGATLMNSGCTNCHAGATTDYVYTK